MMKQLGGVAILLSSFAGVWCTSQGTCTNTNTTIFMGNGYAQFFTGVSAGENFTIRLMYKSNACNGVLLYAQANRSQNIDDHILLQLQDGQVQFEFNNADSNVVVTLVAPPDNTTRFCNGRWQSLVVTKTHRTANLYVSGTYNTVSSGGTATSTDTDGSLYLGGVPDDLPILRATNLVKAHFTGLLSDVQFSNNKGVFPLSYENAVFIKGVQRDETENSQTVICQSNTPTTTLSNEASPCASCDQYSMDNPLVKVVIVLGTLILLLCLLSSVVIVLLVCSRKKRSKVNYCHKIVTPPPAISISKAAPLQTAPAPRKSLPVARLGVKSLSTWSSSTGSCIYVEPMAYSNPLSDTYGTDTHIYENQCSNIYQTIQGTYSEARYSSLDKGYGQTLRVPVQMAWAPDTEEHNTHED